MVICGVLRLTRFNVISDKLDFNGFIGVPIPKIGILLSTFILSGLFNIYLAIILMVFVSILMISNIRYKKLKSPIFGAIAISLILLIIIPYSLAIFGINIPTTILFIIIVVYILIDLLRRLFTH